MELNSQFEIENGLLGVKRDILMSLIDLMIFRENSLIQNLIGMSGESVCWINHFNFTIARTLCERHLEKYIIPSKRERGEEITIKLKNIMFNLYGCVEKSILINVLIKNTILECTIKINKDRRSGFYVGICTPNQVNDIVVRSLGKNGCGGSFYFYSWGSCICCSGNNRSLYFNEGGILDEEKITAVVNNKNVNNKGGKMNIIRNQKRIPHTIINIPKDGVYLGFTFHNDDVLKKLNCLSVISFIYVNVLPPPFNDGMKCVAYDFHGGFGYESLNHKDEEGNEVPNIWEYYDMYYYEEEE